MGSSDMLERGLRRHGDRRRGDGSRVTTATPPWFVDRSLQTRGRGRSTTLQPPVRKRPIHALSASCHVSVRQRISTRRSRMHSMTPSVLLCSDSTFRQANVTSSNVSNFAVINNGAGYRTPSILNVVETALFRRDCQSLPGMRE